MAQAGDTISFAAYTAGGPAGSGIRHFSGEVLEVRDGEAVVDAFVAAMRPDPDLPRGQRMENIPVGTMRVVLNEGVQVTKA